MQNMEENIQRGTLGFEGYKGGKQIGFLCLIFNVK